MPFLTDETRDESEARETSGGTFSRASTRVALGVGAVLTVALFFAAMSHLRHRDDDTFSFDAATPPETPTSQNVTRSGAQNATREYSRRPSATPKAAATPAPKLIVIHVAGAVKKPGVYKMAEGTRLYQAIARAGGATSGADLNALNLAEIAADSSRIEVPSKDKPREYSPVEAAPRENYSPSSSAPRSSSSAPRSTAPRASPAKTRAAELEAKLRANPIDLNRATSVELEQLPGIGPAMAARILEYRAENGRFSSVEELDDVRGIGPKKLEKLRPLVRVN